jgi:HK97 family phage portal protein
LSRLEIYRPRQPKPSLWDRIRSYTLGPLTSNDPALRKYFGGGGDTATGVPVSEYTALNYSAVWSAVNLIAGDVGSLPLVLFRTDGDQHKRYTTHPLYRILHDAPNPEMSSLTLRQTLQAHALTWGNGYAEIERDAVGRPKHLWPITPDRVTPFRDGNGSLAYRVSNHTSTDTIFDPSDIIHIPGLGWDGMQGYSPIAKARECVGIGMAAERFAATFYGNGSTFGGVLTHPTKFATQQARDNFEKSLKSRHKGVERANGLLLLEEGITYEQIGIPPNEAQFLESRQFQITEIARWFNVPPHKIGDLSRSTNNNIEQQTLDYLQTTLLRWLETWEQELMRKLISPLERNQQYIEHIVEGLLRADSAGRAALEATEFQIGGLTPNEARALANRNPVAGGDRAFVQMNMMPLDRLDEYIDAQIASLKPPPAAPAARSDEDEATLTELRGAVTEALAGRATAAEAHAKALAVLADDLTAAKVGQEGLRAEVAAEKGLRIATEARVEALAEQLAVSASLLKDAEERLAIATRTIAERQDDVLVARADRDVAKDEAAALDATAGKLADRVGALCEQLNSVEAERNAAQAGLSHTNELLDGAQATIATEQAERAREAAEYAAKVEALEREAFGQSDAIATLTTERNTSVAELAALTDKYALMRDYAQAQEDTATGAVEAATQARDAADAAIDRAAQAEIAKAAAEAAYVERDAQFLERLNIEAQRVSKVITAHRALMVDTMRRVMTKETDRARRHQGTQQKLRAWMGTFYPEHVETLAGALEPVIAAQLAWRQAPGDAAALAREIAEAHCEQSQEQLRMVLAVEDFSASFEKLMQRWEANRPEAVADKFMQEGVSHVRSL